MNSRNVLLVLSLGLVCWRGLPQDPVKQQDPPPVPAPAPAPVPVPAPVPAPASTEMPAGEAGAATSAKPAEPEPRHAIEGVFALKRRVVNGNPDARPGAGYVAITRGHLLVCLAGPGAARDTPLVTASVQSWEPKGQGFATEVKLGFFSDVDGELHLEPRGLRQVRRIEVARGMLRVYQTDRSFLEFERVE